MTCEHVYLSVQSENKLEVFGAIYEYSPVVVSMVIFKLFNPFAPCEHAWASGVNGTFIPYQGSI